MAAVEFKIFNRVKKRSASKSNAYLIRMKIDGKLNFAHFNGRNATGISVLWYRFHTIVSDFSVNENFLYKLDIYAKAKRSI